jgi:hypothetical protein
VHAAEVNRLRMIAPDPNETAMSQQQKDAPEELSVTPD